MPHTRPVEFTQLWVATKTTALSDAGTDDPIAVIVNQDGVDKIHYTVADTSQTELRTGRANIYQIPVDGSGLASTIDLADGTYFRIALRGPNAWVPEHVFIWGADPGDVEPLHIPLALRFNIHQWFSSDQSEGPVSFPVHRVAMGDLDTPINRLVLLVETSGQLPDAGTENNIHLVIEQPAAPSINFITTDDDNQEANAAKFYHFPCNQFQKSELDGDAITLEILGDDAWAPSRLFLFGLEVAMNNVDVEAVVPLVHLRNWPSDLPPYLSTDPTDADGEAEASVVLPLVT